VSLLHQELRYVKLMIQLSKLLSKSLREGETRHTIPSNAGLLGLG
jgi:hypothetical protein